MTNNLYEKFTQLRDEKGSNIVIGLDPKNALLKNRN